MEIFVIMEHCAIAGECEDNVAICKNLEEAKRILDRYLESERDPKNDGSIYRLQNRPGVFEETNADDYYECWISGDYARNHYKIAMVRKVI